MRDLENGSGTSFEKLRRVSLGTRGRYSLKGERGGVVSTGLRETGPKSDHKLANRGKGLSSGLCFPLSLCRNTQERNEGGVRGHKIKCSRTWQLDEGRKN